MVGNPNLCDPIPSVVEHVKIRGQPCLCVTSVREHICISALQLFFLYRVGYPHLAVRYLVFASASEVREPGLRCLHACELHRPLLRLGKLSGIISGNTCFFGYFAIFALRRQARLKSRKVCCRPIYGRKNEELATLLSGLFFHFIKAVLIYLPPTHNLNVVVVLEDVQYDYRVFSPV